LGKEITINFYSPEIATNQTFYTDSNGLEMQQRILNYRPTWEVNITEPMAGNYFPVNSAIYIQDVNAGKRMTILNDRSQGGSGMRTGEIELMIQRRILHDDNRGVGEPLNETDPDGQGIRLLMWHHMILGKFGDSASQRHQQYNIDYFPLTFIGQSNTTSFQKLNTEANITTSTPPKIKLYIREYDAKSMIVRLHNLDETNPQSVTMQDSHSNLQILQSVIGSAYQNFHTINITEMILTTVQTKENMLNNKYTWNDLPVHVPSNPDYSTVELKPLEMKVYWIYYGYNSIASFEELAMNLLVEE